MAIPVAFLYEALPTMLALVRSFTPVHAEVVVSIAELLEGVATCEAHESLVRSPASFVLKEDLGETLSHALTGSHHCLELLVSAFVNYF